MPQYNPVYGELLSSREVSDITVYTLNQLRNQRQRPDTSPFPFIRLGGTSFYRKADIDSWIDANGGLEIQYVVSDHHKPAPLEMTEDNQLKREHLSKLAKITTANAWTSMATWLIEQSGIENGTKFIHDEGKRLLAVERKCDASDFGTPNAEMKSNDPDAFWKIWTYGVRKGFAQVNSLEVSDTDIIKIPVGDVPPMKTT